MDVGYPMQLCDACTEGDLATVKMCLERGDSMHKYYNAIGPALAHASLTGQIEVVKYLMQSGALINFTTEDGNTALQSACYGGHSAVVEILLGAGASIETVCVDHRSDSAILYARNAEITDVLLRAGADVHAVDVLGNTAMHRACLAGDLERVKTLMRAGADINSRNNDGDTPLHCAALVSAMMSSDLERSPIRAVQNYYLGLRVIGCLVNAGAMTNVPNKRGDYALKTWLQYADIVEHSSPVKPSFWRMLGANPDLAWYLNICRTDEQFMQEVKMFFTDRKDAILRARDHNGNNILHVTAMYPAESSELVMRLVGDGQLLHATNKMGVSAMQYLLQNGRASTLRKCGVPFSNKIAAQHNSLKRAVFNGKASIITTTKTPSGWAADFGLKGALILSNERKEDEQENEYVVFLPNRKVYGVLWHNRVRWLQDERCCEAAYDASSMQLFYGVAEIGQNLVWKPIDEDPSMFLNFYSKASNFNKTAHVLLRTLTSGTYHVETLECSVEVLKVFGKKAIQTAFRDCEVLSLRNICGAGTSLTHGEWDIMYPEMDCVSEQTTEEMLDYAVFEGVSKACKTEIMQLVLRVLSHHPLEGNSRLCNKLLSLISDVPHKDFELVLGVAEILFKRIKQQTCIVYQDLTSNDDIPAIIAQVNNLVDRLPQRSQPMSQFLVSRKPNWCQSPESPVDQGILLQLLFRSSKFHKWDQISADSSANSQLGTQHVATNSQAIVVEHIRKVFQSEFTPTYDILLAKGYIKVAQVLIETFTNTLNSLFGYEKVKVAPVKNLVRVRYKLGELRDEKRGPPPYAAYLCDYLRATVLCDTLEEMVRITKMLCDKFEVMRIKSRIHPEDDGNKVLLINVVIEDLSIKPNTYKWSDWWKKGEVKMIGEVQVSMTKMYYLNKQAHHIYEIARIKTSASEWKALHTQGYAGVEQQMFPTSPLHCDNMCLL